MFYAQFLNITDALNQKFVEAFDYWLATLPMNESKNITASFVSAKFEVLYSQAEIILDYANKEGIVDKYYLGKCPDCGFNVVIFEEDELAEVLMERHYCNDCEKEVSLSVADIYAAYKVVKRPDLTEEEIAERINATLEATSGIEENFTKADSLINNPDILYNAFYNPDEEAYEKMKELRTKLDLDYGKNTTAKGNALESLVCNIFQNIKTVSATTEIKTETNQFDCTLFSGVETLSLSVFSYLSPYFIIECKNEPKKKPNNTYCNKLLSIMETNEAKLGIVFGRIEATSTCYTLAREHYLVSRNGQKKTIILTFSDADLLYIIDKRVNLLKYLEFKIFQITSGSLDSKFEMFESK